MRFAWSILDLLLLFGTTTMLLILDNHDMNTVFGLGQLRTRRWTTPHTTNIFVTNVVVGGSLMLGSDATRERRTFCVAFWRDDDIDMLWVDCGSR